MEHTVERELLVPGTADEVWSSLATPDWLGEDAEIELRPSGSVRAGQRSGFVEAAEEPRRLCFWWSEDGGEASRVELELTTHEEGTLLRVVETRPLAVLDACGHDLASALRPAGPEMSAAPCLVA
jgi:uncharacterized protein YndB with AHSA1/START domain